MKIIKIIKVNIAIIIFITLYSCTFSRYVQGVVIDAETQTPIENARIRIENIPDSIEVAPMTDEESSIYTDSIGRFEIFSPTAGLFVCPKMTLSFEKEGYNKVTKKYRNWNDNEVIILEKQTELKGYN
ncbi:MAG: carboxypeptidase-like regulatory domain-containing protein [Bacteroidales bacterium]|jgi:hypothetical protein|nr:carboxypeptidase-like regulatory domain-containing protein [Bacteroidales bacterium]